LLTCFHPSESSILPSEKNALSVLEETTYSNSAGELIAHPLDKTDCQIQGENISPLSVGGGAEGRAEIAQVGVEQLSNTVMKARYSPWRNWERAKIKSYQEKSSFLTHNLAL
jgi:hypothetical protein